VTAAADAVPLLRTSERSEFVRCRQAWDWAYVQRIKPATASPPLRFGTLVHRSLEPYYKKGRKRGPHPATTFAKLYTAELIEAEAFGFKDEDGVWNDAATLGETMLNGYVDHYGADDAWRVIATEFPFQVPVLHPRTGELWFIYTGVIDLVAENLETKFVGLVDHKTTKEGPTKVAYLSLDEQAGAYWRYGRQALYDRGMLSMNKELNGIIFNFLLKKMPDDRPQNAQGYYLNGPSKAALVAFCSEAIAGKPGSLKKRLKQPLTKCTLEELIKAIGPQRAAQLGEISKNQPGPLFYRSPVWRNDAEGDNVHRRVLEQMREMQLARRGELAIYKAPGKMVCGMCGFKDMCELHESNADWEALRDATMAEWDPYAEHETYIASTR
jgi:hypothetical protein